SAAVFFVILSDNPKKATVAVRFAPFFGILALSFANYYAYILTGRSEKRRLFGRKPLTDRGFLIGITLVAVLLAVLLATGQFIAEVNILESGQIEVSFGPFMYVVVAVFVMGTIRNSMFLSAAYYGTTDQSFRKFLVLNTAAFHTIFGTVIVLMFILPLFGYHHQEYAFLAFPVAVMIFYTAIVRYQFARVDDLNLSLERKVEERTAELRNAQAKLVQSEKMASLGQLVAGIAHEVNNPIGAVRSMAQSNKTAVEKLRDTIADAGADDQARFERILHVMDQANRVIEDGTNRVGDVVETLRNFANLDEAEFQWFDVHEGLEDAVAIMEYQTKPGVTIHKQYGQVPRVNCYPAQLNQVFLNILTNANEAITGDGQITISTRAENRAVCVEFTDTGLGIPANDLGKIFDPGFTTKGVGVGTGLGLAICYQIVRDHDGEIRVESEEGVGSTFTVVLPAGVSGR
ncbi:MAG: hypothetical protein JSW50_09760, partial [Candidatus Latescibacterota bacterium]